MGIDAEMVMIWGLPQADDWNRCRDAQQDLFSDRS